MSIYDVYNYAHTFCHTSLRARKCCHVCHISALRVISLIRLSLIRFQGLDLKKKSPTNDQRLCALSSDSHGKLRFRQGLDRKSGNLIKEIGRTYLLHTPSPPTKSFDFRRFDSSKLLILKGGNSHVHQFYRESPGKSDSRTLSTETLSRWTGRNNPLVLLI